MSKTTIIVIIIILFQVMRRLSPHFFLVRGRPPLRLNPSSSKGGREELATLKCAMGERLKASSRRNDTRKKSPPPGGGGCGKKGKETG